MTTWKAGLLCALAVAVPAQAQQTDVSPEGAIAVPAITVPSSPLMSREGNESRVEHILTKRKLKGQPIDALDAALFGPGLTRMQAAYPQVRIRADRIAGVPVLVYEPSGPKVAAGRDKVLINVHGGGFVGCFHECGGVESIPVAARTGIKVISIDYREFPEARFPAASQDVASVYREILKRTPARKIGLYGCSAGGLLTAQSLAWFQSHGLPAPAAAGIFCAGADATLGGDSRYIGNLLGDGEVPRAAAATPPLGYMAGASPQDPNAFPIVSKEVLAHYPPTLIITGTRDFGMSGAVYLHSRLVALHRPSDLQVWEGGRHAFFYDIRIPEANEVFDVIARFFEEKLG
ncbi:alpha/beta hydrolase [Novosphingobium rosa]|uniref:alpha/beta hydrolase n=1 Tax=Novosphingobium rosa TaxID=76978 RepID=UPI000B2BC1DE|nr:alpha/beta hydrolase [Novosphingobium rosa]